jgi:SDR family mycofactocin-dependent oxidoreductase
MGRVAGHVALITGAARGQGRSHAIRLADEGADIIAVDICEQIEGAFHSMATDDDLKETVRAVEALGRRVFSAKVDVRDRVTLAEAVDAGVAELGRLDIVSANAGIGTISPVVDMDERDWRNVLDVNLTGAFFTAKAAVPHIIAGGRGGSVIFTSSVYGMTGGPNCGHYASAKHGLIGLMRTLARELGPKFIRVNAICPGNVDTPMIANEAVMRLFMPHLEHPTREDAMKPDSNYVAINALPVPWVEPVDITNALLFLASDDARFITGVALPVDAGFLL